METPATPGSYQPESNPMLPRADVPPPTPPSPKPGSSMRVVWIALAGVVVLASGAYAWMMWNPASPIAMESPSPTPTATATADPTAGWKIYTNAQYGFEVRDPYSASAETVGGKLVITFATPPGETRAVISIEKSNKTAQQWFDALPKTANYIPVAIPLSISGEPAIRVDSGEWGLSQVAVQHGGYFYFFDGNMIDPLLSTFKFTK